MPLQSLTTTVDSAVASRRARAYVFSFLILWEPQCRTLRQQCLGATILPYANELNRGCFQLGSRKTLNSFSEHVERHWNKSNIEYLVANKSSGVHFSVKWTKSPFGSLLTRQTTPFLGKRKLYSNYHETIINASLTTRLRLSARELAATVFCREANRRSS